MSAQENFLKQYETWYASNQGSFVLSNSIHLTKKMLSHWPRRGHSLLAIGFGHWKSLEILWESGFDVSAIAASSVQVQAARQALQHKVEIYSQSFEQLPFDDKSFDYVILMPPPRQEPYPALHAMLKESIRLAKHGILVQFWNTISILGLWSKWQKLPYFLRHRWLVSWRDAHNTLRTLAPKGVISTGSILCGPPNTWQENVWLEKANTHIIPLPIGSLVQLRLSFLPQKPLTGIPIALDPRQIKSVQPLVAMERQNNN